MDDFPDRLREARSKAGLTQQELAAVIDVSKPTMSLYESGKMMPRDTKLHALADALGVSFSWLKNGADEGEDLPGELKEKLIESARASGRSLNAEIIHRLEFTFEIEEELPGWEAEYGIKAPGCLYDSLIPMFERAAARVAEIEALGLGGLSVDDRLKKMQQDISEMKQMLKSR